MTDNDARELDQFERYMRRRARLPKESEHDAYAAVYGEQVFPPAPPSPKEPT